MPSPENRRVDKVHPRHTKPEIHRQQISPPPTSTALGDVFDCPVRYINQRKRRQTRAVIPAEADDNYVAQLASLMHNTLDPSLHVYTEYSNEVWNF
jgi:hypothetical protein